MGIENQPEMFNQYITELHNHLFEGKSIDELLTQLTTNHRANHLITLYAMKDQSTFDRLYYRRADFPGLLALLNAVVAALLVEGDFELLSLLRERLSLTHRMLADTTSEQEKQTVIKHLRSYVLYARKHDPNGFVPPLPAHMMGRVKTKE